MASDEITRQLRRAEYLRQYFADTGREYATGKNIKCPNAAAHTHGDANASARIYENDNGARVKCYGCGGSWDIFALWQKDNGGTFTDAKAALCERFGIARTSGETTASRAAQTSGGNVADVRAFAGSPVAEIGTARDAAVAPDRAQVTKPDSQTAEYIGKCADTFQSGTDGEAGRAYMTRRGISVDTARRFNVGYDANASRKYQCLGSCGAIVIPQGSGCALRSIDPAVGQKDKVRFYPPQMQRVLFNGAALTRAAKDNTPVFIVEGEMDALSFAEVGAVAVSTGGTSGFRKATQAAAQIGRGVYVPCMDRDEQGEEAQKALVEKLRKIGGAVYVYADAPQYLLPDAADGTHPKDANEALQKDAAAFRARVAEIIRKAKEYAQAEDAKRKPYITLAEVPEPPDETKNPRALFRGGWLRKGGGVIAASVAGAGKSTFSLQCALHWVLGVSCFGIEPVRPLKIAVIQAEDDVEELAMFRANMKQGLAADGFTPERIDEALKRLHIRTDFLGKTGADFANALGAMQRQYHYDLVIVNPLNSYFDGDISLNKDATEFFRKMIDPVIKNPETECGILFVHHMAKPAKGKDAATFAKGAYAQYALQGGAELNNWARAVLIMIPFESAPDFWTLTAAKRHKPLAWKDVDGNPTKDKIIAYSDNCIYWREPSAAEIRAARDGIKPSKETEEERKRREDSEYEQAVKELVSYLKNLSVKQTKTEVRTWCIQQTKNKGVWCGFNSCTNIDKKTGENRTPKPCNRAFDDVMGNPYAYGVAWEKSGNGQGCGKFGGVAPVTGGAGAAQMSPETATGLGAAQVSPETAADTGGTKYDDLSDLL